MRIGITGGTGFIGKYLLRDYCGEHEFVLACRNITDSFLSLFENKNLVIKQSDFSVDSLKEIWAGCDAVVHLAVQGMPKDNSKLSIVDYSSNIFTSMNVFEACREIGIKNVVCMSSKSAVCLGTGTLHGKITEETPKQPEDEYGVTKQCVENMADFYNRENGMQIKIFRMAEVCGMDLIDGLKNPFWKVVMTKCLNSEPVSIYGTGQAGRDLIYVKDVTKAIMKSISIDEKGIFNIASGKVNTNLEIAEMFCEIFDNDKGCILLPDKEEWGTNNYLSTEKTSSVLGFEAQYDLKGIVSDIKTEYELWKKK